MRTRQAARGVSHLVPDTPGGEETPGATEALLPHVSELLDLPALEAPSLDGLRVDVVARSSPTPDELILRLHQKLRALAPSRERDAEEGLEMGDDAECDLAVMVDGRLLPDSVRSRVRLEMREFPHLPGLAEAMVGMRPFSARTVSLRFPMDYTAPDLAGQEARVYVETRRIFAVQMPALEDCEALRSAGLGDSLEDAMVAVGEELDAEIGEELLVQATQTVLEVLADRVQVAIPSHLVDTELRQTWDSGGGAFLLEKRFSSALTDQARSDFLSHHGLRQEAERRLKIALALGALVRQEGLGPDPDVVADIVDSAAEGAGVTVDEARQSLRERPLAAKHFADISLYLSAVKFVMARAIINVIDE